MTTTAKGIPELSTAAFIKDGPADVNAALNATDALLDQRGKSIIATTETRTNTAYGLLTTPDRVQNIVLPTDGVIMILYRALWKLTSGVDGRAAIFIGSNQLKIAEVDGAPKTQAAAVYNSDLYHTLTSAPFGLISADAVSTDESVVTTGQVVGSMIAVASIDIGGSLRQAGTGAVNFAGSDATNTPLGGAVWVEAAAGTYDISVQFKATSGGTISAKNRKLWVRAVPF